MMKIRTDLQIRRDSRNAPTSSQASEKRSGDTFERSVLASRLPAILTRAKRGATPIPIPQPTASASAVSGDQVAATPIPIPRPQTRGRVLDPAMTKAATPIPIPQPGGESPFGDGPGSPGLPGSNPKLPDGPGSALDFGPLGDALGIGAPERLPLDGQGLPGHGPHGPGHSPEINPRFGGASVANGPKDENTELLEGQADEGFRSPAQEDTIDAVTQRGKDLGGKITDFDTMADGSVVVEITYGDGAKTETVIEKDGKINDWAGVVNDSVDGEPGWHEARVRLAREHGAEIDRATNHSDDVWIGQYGNPIARDDDGSIAASQTGPDDGAESGSGETVEGWRGRGPVDPVDEHAGEGRGREPLVMAGSVLSRFQIIDPIEES